MDDFPKAHLNTSNKIIIGIEAIANHKTHILTNKTTAKANNGKNSAAAKRTLIKSIKKADVTSTSCHGPSAIEV